MITINKDKIKASIQEYNAQEDENYEMIDVEVGFIDFNEDSNTWVDSFTTEVKAQNKQSAINIAMSITNEYIEDNLLTLMADAQ